MKIPQTCCCCSWPRTCQSSHLSYWGRCRAPPRHAPPGCSGWRRRSPWRPWPASWWWTLETGSRAACSLSHCSESPEPWSLNHHTQINKPTPNYLSRYERQHKHVKDEELLAAGCGGVNPVAADLPDCVRHALHHGESAITALIVWSYHRVSLNGPGHVGRPTHFAQSKSQQLDLHVRVGDIIFRLHILHVAAVSGLDHLLSGENGHSSPNIVPILLCPRLAHLRSYDAGQSGLTWDVALHLISLCPSWALAFLGIFILL